MRLQNWSRGIKGWSDIPYHYIVAPDGTVYAARPWQIPGDTNTEYQPQGHALLMLLGNFEVQYPTEAQIQATAWLLARLQTSSNWAATKSPPTWTIPAKPSVRARICIQGWER